MRTFEAYEDAVSKVVPLLETVLAYDIKGSSTASLYFRKIFEYGGKFLGIAARRFGTSAKEEVHVRDKFWLDHLRNSFVPAIAPDSITDNNLMPAVAIAAVVQPVFQPRPIRIQTIGTLRNKPAIAPEPVTPEPVTPEPVTFSVTRSVIYPTPTFFRFVVLVNLSI